MHRWHTRFGRWARSYGPTRLARTLGVGPAAVSHWASGYRSPRPALALRIVQLAGGAVSLQDIYTQRAWVQRHEAGYG